MSLGLIIVGGIVILSVVASISDYLTKTKVAKSSIDPETIHTLERRVAELEEKASRQENRIQSLESDISFANKLLEDRTKG
jgi:hypothetical protein